MKKWAVIGTWKLSLEGNKKAAEMLKSNCSAGDAAVAGCQNVEDNPLFQCIGYGGLPDLEGHVTLDAGYMDGESLKFGAVADVEGFRSPVAMAQLLSTESFNNFLVGQGAEKYGDEHGFERRVNLTPESLKKFQEESKKQFNITSYSESHDTVCFLTLDQSKTLCAATSTSGLFLKHPGRVGDTPVPGCGFYADDRYGCAAATGVGEDIMKGALSYQVVSRMKNGESVQDAAMQAVFELDNELKKRTGESRNISLIALDRDGNFGVGTNVPFPFSYSCEGQTTILYFAQFIGGALSIQEVTDPTTIHFD